MKLAQDKSCYDAVLSRPARARGLKHDKAAVAIERIKVAPRAGAWIETEEINEQSNTADVAPRAGAWIETDK